MRSQACRRSSTPSAGDGLPGLDNPSVAPAGSLGETNAGIHEARIGWVLPETCDPDGNEVMFYTQPSHRQPAATAAGAEAEAVASPS